MYKFYSRPKAKSSSVAAIISIAAIAYVGMNTLSPQKTESIDSRVFVEGVTIHLSRNAPPLAALEDSIMDSSLAFEDQIPESQIKTKLVAGVESLEEFAQQVIRDNGLTHYNEIGIAQVRDDKQTNEKTISLKELGISREELLDALFIPMIQPEAHSPKGGANRDATRVIQARQWAPAARDQIKPQAQATQASYSPKSVETHPSFNLSAETTPRTFAQSNLSNQLTLVGRIEMSQGLAFTSPKDRIVVYHEQKNQILESAVVRMKEAQFEISVNEMSGLLVAELRSQSGEVLGLGRATLDQKNILIRLEPTTQGLVGRVIAAGGKEDLDQHPLKNAKLMVDMIPHEFSSEVGGKFSDPNLVNSSTMILKSQRNGYLNSISMASAGDENLVPMYSNKMVRELLSLQSNSDIVNNPERDSEDSRVPDPISLKNQSIIWGKISKNGGSIAGAQVEILTADQSLKPIYFNKMMIPDLSLTVSSSNGYYAFVGVNPGVHAVQVTYGSGLSEPSVIPADSNSISQLDIDVAKSKQADVIAFDAFHTEKSVAATISQIGQSSSFETNASGRAKMHYSEGSGLMVLDVDAGPEFEVSRLTLTRNKNTIYSPLISQAWFDHLRSEAHLDVIAYTGSIVGFIQGDRPFKAAFGEKLSETTQIIYFNSQGDIIHADHGEPGGGFVVFNAPEGLLTVSVVLENTDKILTQTAYVDRSVVNVFSHWFH